MTLSAAVILATLVTTHVILNLPLQRHPTQRDSKSYCTKHSADHLYVNDQLGTRRPIKA